MKRSQPLPKVFARVAVLALATACTVAPTPATPTPVPAAAPFSGPALRVVMPFDNAFGKFGDGDRGALDPQRDWPAPYDTGELMRCCLARTLLSSNGRATQRGGARIHPDLAAELPQISADGLTWTFQLKKGLHYAPPLADVEITAVDFIRSLHRFLAPEFADDYAPSLLIDIAGAEAYRAGEATSISGFETPDPHTLVIRLTEPAGDLAARLAMAGVVPVPPNPHSPDARFGVAEGHDLDYGRYFVASGPYMIEGSESLDFSVPPAQQMPVSGLLPGVRVTLVPNPSWDAQSDDLRVGRHSRIEVAVVGGLEEAVAEIEAGLADVLVNASADPPVPEEAADRVRDDPSLGRVHIYEGGTQLGMSFNVAQPPFDDINVRRAVSHAIDKQQIVEALGGPLRHRVGHHIVPDSMLDNLLVDYRPYGQSDGRADLEAAKAAMALSAYDTDHDGVCDADACRDINGAFEGSDRSVAMGDLVRAALEPLGLSFNPEGPDIGVAYADPSLHAALFMPFGWGRDYLSASNFFVGQFYSPVALGAFGNPSLVGASAEQLTDWGYEVTQVPNVDARVEACVPLTGLAQFECWAALDQHMMEHVVSFVPFASGVAPVLVSRNVVGYEWDELATAPSYDRLELAPGDRPQPTAVPPSPVALDPAIAGTWRTPKLTTEQMSTALTAAGLDPGAIEMVVEAEGFEESIEYELEFSNGQMAIYGFPDGHPYGLGWSGTYEVPAPGRLTATDRQGDCVFTYEYEIVGAHLSIDLVGPVCSEEDELFQTVILESAPFTRVQ